MPTLLSRIIRFYTVRYNVFDSNIDTIEKRRQRMEYLSSKGRKPRNIDIEPVRANGVQAEWLIPKLAPDKKTLLYIHGGGWTLCSTQTHRSLVIRLAKASGVRALSIDYRLAPEHPFPAALEDTLAAYHYLLDQGYSPQEIVLGGDSAGGNLTLSCLLALKAAGEPLPAGAICLSPATDLTGSGDSFTTKTKVDPIVILPASGIPIHEPYTRGQDLTNPLISPLFGDLHGLPPILIHVGEDEILLDDSTRFVEKACVSGVKAQLVVWKNMFHVFQSYGPLIPQAQKSIDQLGQFIRDTLRA